LRGAFFGFAVRYHLLFAVEEFIRPLAAPSGAGQGGRLDTPTTMAQISAQYVAALP